MTEITRLTQAKERDHKYFFNGTMNVAFEVYEQLTLDEVMWMINDAKSYAINQGGLDYNALFYQRGKYVIVVKSHYAQNELHEEYFFPERDMTRGVVTLQLGDKKADLMNAKPELSLSSQETKYFFRGIPKASPAVLKNIEPDEVLELLKDVQDNVRTKDGIDTPIFEAGWNGHTYRFIDNVPEKFLIGENELNKLANLMHFIRIDLIEQ